MTDSKRRPPARPALSEPARPLSYAAGQKGSQSQKTGPAAEQAHRQTEI